MRWLFCVRRYCMPCSFCVRWHLTAVQQLFCVQQTHNDGGMLADIYSKALNVFHDHRKSSKLLLYKVCQLLCPDSVVLCICCVVGYYRVAASPMQRTRSFRSVAAGGYRGTGIVAAATGCLEVHFCLLCRIDNCVFGLSATGFNYQRCCDDPQSTAASTQQCPRAAGVPLHGPCQRRKVSFGAADKASADAASGKAARCRT